MTQTTHRTTATTDDIAWARLLDEATSMIATNPQDAIMQLKVLADTTFELQPRARQYYGIVLFDAGQYEQAEAVFKQLVGEYKDPTRFRQENLYHAARIALALGEYSKATKWVAEAKTIARSAYDIDGLGRLRLLESTLSAKQGASQRALDEMISGRSMVDIHSRFSEGSTGQTGRSMVGITG